MDIHATIQAFLAFVQDPPTDQADRRASLERHLDALAWMRHEAKYSFDSREHPDPPAKNYDQRRADLGVRFPDLGTYTWVEPAEDGLVESVPELGDALGDLVEIAQDLEEVIWRWNHTSSDDAVFHLMTLMPHWMGHVRNLQHCLRADYW